MARPFLNRMWKKLMTNYLLVKGSHICDVVVTLLEIVSGHNWSYKKDKYVGTVIHSKSRTKVN